MKTQEEKDAFQITLELILSNNQTINLQKHYESIDKYFSIDISPILKENTIVGILIFLKDITQMEHDKIEIKNNQNMLIERERLASLGQMVGGIAHNLKTPIFSISGGLEGLDDLITEFDESIEDNNVTDEDMHEIAKDMRTWITKLKGHTSYMSDVITAVKGQASKFTDEQAIDFNTEEIKIDVVGSDNKNIGVKLQKKLTYTALNEEDNPKTVVLCDKFLYSGVKKGDKVGCVKVFSSSGEFLCESALISTENAPMNFFEKETKVSFFDKIKEFSIKTDRKNYGSR
jgi:hypothetical protein